MTVIEHSNRLPELAAQIRAEHEACTAALKRGLQHAAAAGRLLIEAKDQLKHGQWLPWLREHCGIPGRTARRYMQLAPWVADENGEADEIGHLANLVGDAAETVQSLDVPFNRDDLNTDDGWDWFINKLMHQADLPLDVRMAEMCGHESGLPLLRICCWDDLHDAGEKLLRLALAKDGAPMPIKLNVSTAHEALNAVVQIRVMSMALYVCVRDEMTRRMKRGYSEEKYQRECKETLAAWKAHLDRAREPANIEVRVNRMIRELP